MLIKFLFFFSSLITSCHLTAQAVQPVYQQFTEQDGLPSNYLNCLFQDSKGFIWIGSDKGLTRFDGVNFKTYTTDDGLSGNMILDIKEDQQGQLWIGTFERGLCHFDGEHFACWGKDKGINTVATVLPLTSKVLFYSEGAGNLVRFDIEKKQAETLIDLPVSGIENSLIPFAETQVLFLCQTQLFLLSKDGSKKEVFLQTKDQSFYIKKGITDREGKTWLLDSQNELLLQVKLVGNQLLVLDNLPAPQMNSTLYEGNDFFIANYPKGKVYHIINKKSKTVRYVPNPHVGQNEDMLMDMEGQLWLATVGYGLFVQKGYPYLHQMPQQNGAAYDVEILPNRDVLIGGDKGIWWYDEALNLQAYQAKIEQVRGVKQLEGIGLCAGTLQGETYFFNNESALLNAPLKHSTIVSSGFSGAVSLQKDEAIFSSYGAGLQLFSNGKMTRYKLPSLPNLMVEGLIKTSQGVWITSSSDGVLLINEKENRLFSKQTGLASNNIYTVFESAVDSIWIGSENGATLWNGQQAFSHYTAENGLAGKRITAFFKDRNQQLWAFSDTYLHYWKNQKWHAFKSLTFQKTPEGRVYDVAYDATSHRVFVASTTGAFVLDLEKAQPITTPINFVLESIESKTGIIDTAKLNVLNAQNNAIRIHFSSPSFTRSKANSCYFRLLGKEDAWVKAKDPSFFQFENLPSGNYTLQALPMNPNGVAGEIRSLATFKILPLIWLRWWAILLEILFGITLIGGLIAWYFQRKNKKRLAALQVERELQTERERISRDLHDNIGAQLTNITYKLDLAAYRSKNKEDAQTIEKVSDETRNTMKLLRDTIWALQKDEFFLHDLANKLQSYVSGLEGIDVQFEVKKQIEADWMVSPKEMLHLFRILQEAIQNIIKHAEASQADIIFKINQQQFEISVIDNGKGIAPEVDDDVSHYGLENMAFRAKEIGADFLIKKNQPQGTLVRILKMK